MRFKHMAGVLLFGFLTCVSAQDVSQEYITKTEKSWNVTTQIREKLKGRSELAEFDAYIEKYDRAVIMKCGGDPNCFYANHAKHYDVLVGLSKKIDEHIAQERAEAQAAEAQAAAQEGMGQARAREARELGEFKPEVDNQPNLKSNTATITMKSGNNQEGNSTIASEGNQAIHSNKKEEGFSIINFLLSLIFPTIGLILPFLVFRNKKL